MWGRERCPCAKACMWHIFMSPQPRPSLLKMSASSFSARSWEGWSERTAPADVGPIGADSADYTSVSPDEAGEQLSEMLMQLKITNVLSARQACILAFWAAKAGAVGPCGRMGLRPDADTGKFSAKFDSAVGTSADARGMYMLPLARRLRHDASRIWNEVPVVPPLEALAAELEADTLADEELDRALKEGSLPPLYTKHPAVKNSRPGEKIHPVCVYIDGVEYSRLNNVVGLWAYFALTEKRHLLAVLRKAELCTCGCRGWCSLFPLWCMMRWSAEHLLLGVHPSKRHDGSPFGDSDATRAREWRTIRLGSGH